uniref:Thioredoxin domain-containing protein n=1 Tax=viral metagenome TaxID=1070528 RepID=A0A6C0LLP1_9ZZZZ
MIEKIREGLVNVLQNKKLMVVIILAAIFIAVAIWVYNSYVKPRVDAAYVPNKEFIQDNGSGSDAADLYFFYTTWCPHCKKALPVWEKLKENLESTGVNGVKINFIEVDCDKDPETAERFNVEGYPTIKLSHNKKVIEYDAKPDMDTLNQFLETSL